VFRPVTARFPAEGQSPPIRDGYKCSILEGRIIPAKIHREAGQLTRTLLDLRGQRLNSAGIPQ